MAPKEPGDPPPEGPSDGGPPEDPNAPGRGSGDGPRDDAPLESTASLLRRARSGDVRAENALLKRYRDLLLRWAHGRFRSRYVSLDKNTEDFVQLTLLKALKLIHTFEPRREGALLDYLRKILKNAFLDEDRRGRRRPERVEMPDGLAGHEDSPLGAMITQETMDRYERALAKFKPRTREALIMRLEFGFKYAEIAESLNQRPEESMHIPTANAVRRLIKLAIVRLAEFMREEDP